MRKDPQFKIVRSLIEAGQITLFREIFEYISVSAVAYEALINYPRMAKLINHPHQFQLLDCIEIANLFEVDERVMIDLVMAQVEKEKGKELRKKYEERIKREK